MTEAGIANLERRADNAEAFAVLAARAENAAVAHLEAGNAHNEAALIAVATDFAATADEPSEDHRIGDAAIRAAEAAMRATKAANAMFPSRAAHKAAKAAQVAPLPGSGRHIGEASEASNAAARAHFAASHHLTEAAR